MTDQTGYSGRDTKLNNTSQSVASPTMLTNKRKRDSLDHGAGPSSRPPPGDHARGGGYQRVSTNSATSTTNPPPDLSDPTGAAFLAAHGHPASVEDEMHPSSTLDFTSQLVSHGNDHSLHQNGGANPPTATDTAAAALSHYNLTVPQGTELSFQGQTSGGEQDRPLGASFGISENTVQQPHAVPDYNLDALKAQAPTQPARPPIPPAQSPPTTTPHKPPVGSEEWHKVRRDNHKEVERRRRETINEGINELAKIVPGCEKNKGSILQRAVQFITQLKENEQQNIEKWTLEKLLTEQAIQELSASVDKFKAECQRAWEECAIWKKACVDAGIAPEEFKGRADIGEQNGES